MRNNLKTFLIICSLGLSKVLLASEQANANSQLPLSSSFALSHAIALGITQGITEFLPVSSTGHMILVNGYFLNKLPVQAYEKTSTPTRHSIRVERALKNYMVCIQLGTIFTLVFFYRKEILRMLHGLFGKDKQGFLLLKNLVLAFFPVGVLGFLFGNWIHEHLYSHTMVVLALVLGALAIFCVEARCLRKKSPMENVSSLFGLSTWTALGIGLFQVLALWPGLSRSLVTILGGVLLGLSLLQAIHFSFLLGLLTSGVATTYKLLTAGSEMLNTLSGSSMALGIGMAFIFGLATIHAFLGYLKTHGLRLFAYYRMVLALLFVILAN